MQVLEATRRTYEIMCDKRASIVKSEMEIKLLTAEIEKKELEKKPLEDRHTELAHSIRQKESIFCNCLEF